MTQPRRGARAKERLSRETVLSSGLDLMDREGLDNLTMRGLAKALGITPMGLYNHVADREDLLRGIAGRILAEAQFDSVAETWRERVAHCFQELRAVCLRHPGAARLMQMPGFAPGGIFAPMETTVGALTGAGLSGTDAVRAYFLLVNLTLGQVSYQLEGPVDGLDPTTASANTDLEVFPAVKQALSDDDWDFDAAFAFGLALVLDGLAQAMRSD